MSNVVTLNVMTRLDISAQRMLNNIANDSPENAFVISWPKDGGLPTYHSSTADMPVILMRLQQFIHDYYNGEFK